MTEDDLYRTIAQGLKYDALIFLWEGAMGLQPILMPNEVYRWHPIADTAERPKRQPSSPQRLLLS